MNKLIFLLLFFVSIFETNAQKSNFEIYTGYNLYNFGNRSLRRSMRSFEEYWIANGEPNMKVKGYKTAHDFNWGFNYLLSNEKGGSSITGFQHYKFTSKCEAEFAYGSRIFKTITKGGNVYFGGRNSKGVAMKLGLGFANSVIESYFIYPSGAISFGKEKSLNGVYGVTYIANMNLEITKQKVFFKHLGVEAGFLLTTNGFTTEYYDPTYAKGVNAPINYSWIPQDFNSFYPAVNTSGGTYEGKNVKGNHNSIGLIFRISYLIQPINKTKNEK